LLDLGKMDGKLDITKRNFKLVKSNIKTTEDNYISFTWKGYPGCFSTIITVFPLESGSTLFTTHLLPQICTALMKLH